MKGSMKQVFWRGVVLLSFTTTYAADPGPVDAQNTLTTCEANFIEQGSFFTGKTYKTWQEHMGVTYDAAFRKVVQTVAADGWGNPVSNKETGVVTASQAVTLGKGATAPLNVIVQEKNGGIIRVDVNFSTAGGQRASADTGRTVLCKIANAPSQ